MLWPSRRQAPVVEVLKAMKLNRAYERSSELPTVIPVFPLAGALLLSMLAQALHLLWRRISYRADVPGATQPSRLP